MVFYNGPAQKANAEELGSLLGIGTLVDSAEFQMPLVVVLGPGSSKGRGPPASVTPE